MRPRCPQGLERDCFSCRKYFLYMFCRLSRVTRTLFLERDVAVEAETSNKTWTNETICVDGHDWREETESVCCECGELILEVLGSEQGTTAFLCTEIHECHTASCTGSQWWSYISAAGSSNRNCPFFDGILSAADWSFIMLCMSAHREDYHNCCVDLCQFVHLIYPPPHFLSVKMLQRISTCKNPVYLEGLRVCVDDGRRKNTISSVTRCSRGN